MKVLLFAILSGILLGVNLLAIAPPQDVHDPTYCATNHKDASHRCDCVMQDMGAGCKDGKRDVEMKMCLAYCDKHMCSCCAS